MTTPSLFSTLTCSFTSMQTRTYSIPIAPEHRLDLARCLRITNVARAYAVTEFKYAEALRNQILDHQWQAEYAC